MYNREPARENIGSRSLLEYRQLTKLKSTYVDGLLSLMDPVIGRVHTTFSQDNRIQRADCRRQPQPAKYSVRTEVGRGSGMRSSLTPLVLLTADYSQFRVRILAHITPRTRLWRRSAGRGHPPTITAASLFRYFLCRM